MDHRQKRRRRDWPRSFRRQIERLRAKLEPDVFRAFIHSYYSYFTISLEYGEHPIPPSFYFDDWSSVRDLPEGEGLD